MKRSLAVIGCLLASQSQAVQLTGNYIPQKNFETQQCDPHAVYDDFIYSGQTGKRASPRNCATVNARNPAFWWTLPPDLDAQEDHPATLTVTSVATNADGTPVYKKSFENIKVPRYIYNEGLESREYTWTVSYNNGTIVSKPRRFFVEETQYTLPTPPDVFHRVSTHSRPRALNPNVTYDQIRAQALLPESQAAYHAFIEEADYFRDGTNADPTDSKYSTIAPPTAADQGSLGYNNNQWLTYLGNAAGRERKAIETLGHAYFFTKDVKYLVACRERLTRLALWDHDPDTGVTSENNQDQANREIFLALAIGLDILESPLIPDGGIYKLTEKQLNDIITPLKARIDQARASVRRLGTHPYLYAHTLTEVHFLTEALMYAQGLPGFTEADGWLKEAWVDLITSAGPWGGAQDGGYGNSTHYAWVSLHRYARTLAAVRVITAHNLTNYPPFGGFGMNLIQQTPPAHAELTPSTTHRLMNIFGDGTDRNNEFWDSAWSGFRLYAHVTGKPEYEWYWRTMRQFITRVWAPPVYHFLMLPYRAPKAPDVEPTIANSAKFEDAGYVAFHSNVKDAARSSVFFRSSPLGSENHSHADNNSFVFVSKGKEIFISSGAYDWYNSPHHDRWTRHTKAKNALTFDDGIGQSIRKSEPGRIFQSADARGKLVNYHDQGEWRIATGDASAAYQTYDASQGSWSPLLQKAYRTVAYRPRDGVAIIYDYALSDKPRRWELNFHTLAEPKLDEDGTMMITRPSTGPNDPVGAVTNCVLLVSPAAKFVPPSEIVKSDDDLKIMAPLGQFHTRRKTVEAKTDFAALTIIRENCSSVPEVLSTEGSKMTVKVNNAIITFDKKTVTFDQ